MITLTTILVFLAKAYEFIKKYKRIFVIGLIALLVLLLALRLTSCESKPDTHIVVPHTAIKELQKQRDAELQKTLLDIDDRRRNIDGKVIEPKVSGKKNVTAKDLEEVTK
jgi:hypothetical protein